jgi:hypothetical protein
MILAIMGIMRRPSDTPGQDVAARLKAEVHRIADLIGPCDC